VRVVVDDTVQIDIFYFFSLFQQVIFNVINNIFGLFFTYIFHIVKGMLRGAGLRSNNGGQVKLIASGRVVNGFDLVKLLALGADVCNSARAMMFALGCIQALACNTNRCPTGITTNNPMLMAGLDVQDKGLRVQQYQAKTVHTALEIIGACGLDHPSHITTEHIWKRFDGFEAKSYKEIYMEVPVGSLLDTATGGKGKRKKPVFEEWWCAGGEVSLFFCSFLLYNMMLKYVLTDLLSFFYFFYVY
tara:strand:+ start:831 stop:1565 length:735 start_codon:yes stop_codon:yes gene_type:complete